MKKRVAILSLFIILCGFAAQAQGQYNKPLKSTNQSILGFSNYNIGFKIGCPWSYMAKSDLHHTTYDGNFGYLVGLMVERNLGKWSVALESSFAQKGTRMHNEKPYQISLQQDGILKTKYKVSYNVAAIRIPITYYFKGTVKDDKVIPYVFFGPEVDIPLGFNFDLWHFTMEKDVKALYQQFDGPTGEQPLPEGEKTFDPGINVSAVVGVGLMTKVRFENSAIIFKFDAAYNQGLMNLAVSTKEAWQWPFKNQEPRIFANDVEVSFSVVYPIKRILHNACYNFRR